MFESRNYPNFPESILVEFDHSDPDLIDTYTSPFPAIIFTLEGYLLGFGKVLGKVEEANEVVLEIDDQASPTGKVHMLDCECWWNVAIPEIVEKYKGMDTISAYDYFLTTDALADAQSPN